MSWLPSSGMSLIKPTLRRLLFVPRALLVRADYLAEQLVFLAVEALQLNRLQGRVVVRPGGDGDAGEQRIDAKALHRRGLLHDVLAGQVVAALLEHLHERLRHGVA